MTYSERDRARLRALIEDPTRNHLHDIGRSVCPKHTRRPSLLARLRTRCAERVDTRNPLAERPRIAVAPRVIAWSVDEDAVRESIELARMQQRARERHDATRFRLAHDELLQLGDGAR